ncbi:hypothetical protein [Sandaracinobacteroides hominis]|uniref:hypothetical protein n=1 Tax=Sandaracinobacteroides hominis TaxID=2780086 RepID=UPI0018F27D72|nr:hypothetical protein [Sandaracinobacteroides hominis]
MLGSRRGRPSLFGRAAGTAARTAIITKTATAVAGSSAEKQMAKAHAAELAHAEKMAAVGGGDAAAAAPAGDLLDALRKLAVAHDAGILTDTEFAAKVKERLA